MRKRIVIATVTAAVDAVAPYICSAEVKTRNFANERERKLKLTNADFNSITMKERK